MVPPCSHRVSRVRRYSGSSLPNSSFVYGTLTLCGWLSHAIRLDSFGHDASPNPEDLRPSVWPPPRSLATTSGISVDVFSSPYLDVSVQAVPHVHLFDSMHVAAVLPQRVSPFGNLRIDAYVPLPGAYRSLSRPSSAPDAKAFPLRSFSLNLLVLKNYAGSIRFPSVEIAFTQFAFKLCLLLPSCLLSLFSFQCAKEGYTL